MILENVSADVLSLDLATLVPNRRPSTIEFMSMPDLVKTDKLPARIERQDLAGEYHDTSFFSDSCRLGISFLIDR